MTKIRNIIDIQESVRQFARERDWEKFHSPKNISMALSVEVAELLEHFQWLTEEQSSKLDEETLSAVADEIADVQVYLARLADLLNIDIFDAVDLKLQKNAKKYPVDKVRGSAKKYTHYITPEKGDL